MRFPFSNCRSILLFTGDVSKGADTNFLQWAGCDVDGAILLLSQKGKTLITSKMNASKAGALFDGRVMSVDSGDIGLMIRKLAPKGKIGLDLHALRAQRYIRLAKLLGKNRLVDVSEQLDEARRVKKADEIAKIRKAVRLSKDILDSLSLRPDMTELDVVRELARGCLEREVKFAFPPIVAAGENSREPHHDPAKKRLGHGIVLIDFGAQYQHYCADLSRCYFLGPCKEEKKKYEEAKEMHRVIVRAIPRMKTGGELGRFADQYARKIGWGRMIHSIGHGLGVEVHDAPHLGLRSKERLGPGVVLAIEPGWYGKKFGVRFEDDVVIGKKTARVL